VVGAGNVNYTVVDGVLFNTDMTLLHTYPAAKTGNEYTIPDGVTSIGDDTFFGCTSLATITIPDSVTSIGAQAFWSCGSLATITFLGSAPTTVGDNAFSGMAANAQAIVTPEAQASFGEVGAAWNGLLVGTQETAAPPNDLFENAQIVSGVGDFGSIIGTNVKATMEQGEPTQTAGWDSGSSVWYLWEAPATGTFSMRARGDFDTQLALFGGESTSSLEDLTLLDESDPQDITGDSLVTWNAIDGVSYWLRVTGYHDVVHNVVEVGDFTLDWSIHPVFQPVYTFAASTGRWPRQMLQGADGYSYGVAIIGGAGDLGTIFRLSPDGEVSTLAEFTGGEGPVFGTGGTATLLQCRDGEFYGTTSFGEQYTFFTMTPQGDFTTLYQFPEGVSTWGGLIQGSDGDFYGHTVNGGEEGRSTVFKLSPTGAFTHIASFSDRMYPQSAPIEEDPEPALWIEMIEEVPEPALIEGLDGNFYGTTLGGGAFDAGTIFKVTLEGTITTLFEFGALYGMWVGPYSLMQDWDGNFYGTTNWGGDGFDGSVFRMTAEGVYTELVSFDGPLSGSAPANGLIQGSDGSLYGTTQEGGASDNGTVFRVTVAGALTTLVEFTGSGGGDVGSIPNGLVLGGNGELYGTTEEGGFGSNNVGTAFRIDPDGTMTTLVDFASLRGGGVGAAPRAALVRGRDGNFYGTTYYDGATDSGTIFRMTPAGITTRLAEFTGNAGPLPGRGPLAPLVEGIDGSFYGVTSRGGMNNNGTIFRITPSGEVVTLFEFGGFDGNPEAPLAQGSDGHFYGTTVSEDEAGEVETVFRITADGAFATVIEFSGVEGPNRGSQPKSALTLAGNGNLYGTTESGGLNNEGTVFMITPEGELTTLVDFSGEEDPSPGSAPLGALVLGSDGNLYGTTSEGGPQDDGTIFRMTEAGEFTSLFAFGGSEAEDHGSSPEVALVEGGDGNFYGMAAPGGRFENETIYMMTPQGVVTTFHEFQESEHPQGPVVAGPDGDLYGVQATDGTAGQIYRMVFRGIPTTYLLESPEPNEGLDRTSATVRSSINPRGALITEVRIEYGTDGVTFPSALSIPISLAGYQGITVGRTLENLEPGTNYFYRFRVSSDLGESVSQAQTFSTLAEPEVALTPVSEVTPISARLNGTVNARNFDSVVTFEYGLDGNDFLNSVAIDPTTAIEGIPDIEQLAGLRIVRGSDDTDVSAQIAGLEAGRTYYYRLVAASVGGFAVSGQGSFRTLTPPVAELGGAEALSTTRVGVHGTVDALGSEVTAIYFEYWSEGQTMAEATLETATPDSASGEGATEVATTLTGLTQGTTYSYRLRAVGPGGTGLSETGTFSLSLLSGLGQTFPDPPTIANGEVTVTLNPSDIGGWRFAGEGQWRNSGETVGNLASGDRQIEYRPAAGYNRPPSELISVASGENVELERAFFSTPTSGEGILTVYLKPENLAATEVPEANRAQWRFLGDEDWQDGEVTIGGLVPGTYLVESKPVDNRVTPPATSVTVENGVPSTLTLTYFSANERTGQGPVLRSFADVSTDEDLPLAYLGQIRSSAGSSTGFVVKRRVVATAGHVVFDDGSLSFISDLQWLFQRHATEYEPRPQTPRGFYLASGYAGARQAEGVVPGVGTPESQDLDYAVLYFQEEAGRGGVAGFLASDAGDENEFLTSSADKMLAGYPVDSIPVTDLGKVHATPLFDESLTPAHGETWTTSDIYGMGGISGGPLFVRQSDGAFYPAAIYLGGDSQAVVRAIDSDVVELFLRAEASGNGGENNTGGGITHTSVAGNLSTTDPGALRVVIEPASANAVGAGWKLVPEATPRPTGASIYGLNPGTYNLVFLTVNGFQAPEMQAVEVTGGQLNTVTFTYEADHVASPLETWRQDNFGTISDSGDAADDADPDQDGVTNINEYTAETDPNDPESYPTRILTITNPTNGTVSGGGAYKLGTEANLEAIPAPGYVFTGWSGDATGSDNPLTIVMDGNQTVGAIFTQDDQDSGARLVKVTFNEDLTAANLFLEGLTPGQVYHVTGTVDGEEFFRFSDSEFTPDASDLEVNQPVDVASRRNLLLKVMEGPIRPGEAIK